MGGRQVIAIVIFAAALFVITAGLIAYALTIDPKGTHARPRRDDTDIPDAPDTGMTSQFAVIAERVILPATPPEAPPAVVDIEPRISGGREPES